MEDGDSRSYVWYSVMWINNHIIELGLTGCYALCFMTVFAVINRRFSKGRRERDNVKPNSELPQDSCIARKLCRMESSIDHLHKYGGSITAYVLLLKSKVYISPNMVKNALLYIAKRHEILRMKITRTKIKTQGKKKIFKEFRAMENTNFAEFLLKLKTTTSDQWLYVFERELMKRFPEEGPLWRFVMLKEQFDPKEGLYSNAFVFSAHHLICDFESGFHFLDSFIDFLNSSIQKESLSKPCIEVEFPIRPSLSHLLRDHVCLSQPLLAFTAAKIFVMKMIERVWPKPTLKNKFTSTFPPTILKDPSIQKKTCFIPRSLKRDETLELVKLCKANKCSVHGAISAATTIGMATVLEKTRSTSPLKVTSSFEVDLRKDCNPQIKHNELGYYSTNCQIEIPLENVTLPINIDDASFWLLAQKCDGIFHKVLMNSKHLDNIKLVNNLNINPMKNLGALAQDKEAAGRHSSLFHVSNLGRKNVIDNGSVHFDGFYFAVAEHNSGPVFSNNIATINGVLYWGFTYFTNVVTEAQAVRYADLVINCLKVTRNLVKE